VWIAYPLAYIPRKHTVLPIRTSAKFIIIKNIFDGDLVHWPQLRKSHIRPDTPYVNQLANKLDTSARRSLKTGMLQSVRMEFQRRNSNQKVPLSDNPSDSPETKGDPYPDGPCLPCSLCVIVGEGAYVDVCR
jgi:hypothetical protein